MPSGEIQNADQARDILGSYPEIDKLADSDLLKISRQVTGLTGKALVAVTALGDEDKSSLAKIAGKVIASGIIERSKMDEPESGKQKELLSEFMTKACHVLEDRGLSRKEAGAIAESCLGDAVDIAPEIEIRLARDGAVLAEKDKETLYSYCARHADKFPMSMEDLHNRAASFGGGLTISLDAPVGDDAKADLYSVFKGGGEGHDDNEPSHLLDSVLENGDNSQPGFMADGGDELMQPFGMSGMADALYRVVSTNGSDIQRDILDNFANAQVESVLGRGGVDGAKEQISAMLDLLDKEDALPTGEIATRRKVLSWVFQSVLNSAGVDDQGFDKMSKAGAEELRKNLLSKIKRYGMPGVLISSGEPVADEEFDRNISKLKDWGYERVGVCLPKGCEEKLGVWSKSAKGDCSTLLLGLRAVGAAELDAVMQGVGGIEDSGIKKSALAILSGDDNGDGEAAKYISSRKDSESIILGALRSAVPDLHNKLGILSASAKRGLSVDFLGDGKNPGGIADAARIDSVLLVDEKTAAQVSSRISEFGIATAVYTGSPDSILSRHADFGSTSGLGQGLGQKIKDSRIPLPRKLVLAALASHENEVRN
jgi:hypothetical protein